MCRKVARRHGSHRQKTFPIEDMKDFPFADDSCPRMVEGKLQDDPTI
jgi:hypothetical protein